MNPVDIAVLVVYFLGISAAGVFFSKRNTSTEAYFLGNRNFPAWAIGLSLVGTSISSISFLAYPGDWIRLDGSRSTGSGELAFVWEQVAGPPVDLRDPETANPTFRARDAGTHIFALSVSDGESWSDPDRSHVVVLDAEMGNGGCGCSQSGAPLGWFVWLPAMLGWRAHRASSASKDRV